MLPIEETLEKTKIRDYTMGSIIMSKNNIDEIIKAVERYKSGRTSQNAEAKRLGVSRWAFQDWVRKYETFGAEGFEHTGNRKYSSELPAGQPGLAG